MAHEQLSFLPEPSSPTPRNKTVDEFASHIAAHASDDPYREQRIRKTRSLGPESHDTDTTLTDSTLVPEISPQDAVQTPTRDNDNWQRPKPEIRRNLTEAQLQRNSAGATAAGLVLQQLKDK